jgi:asparagine synthase (glutamine-hydrolysing)
MAFAASKYSSPTLYVVGEDSSPDMLSARSAAAFLELPLVEIPLSETDVKEALPDIVGLVRSTNPVIISYKLPHFFVSRSAEEEVILIGSGADELFGGYSKYQKMDHGELTATMETDLERLLKVDIPIDNRIGQMFGKSFEYPFLSAAVMEIAMESPMELKVGKEGRKVVLRKVAEEFGLPLEISGRQKKAAQYGTGAMKIMRRIAKSEGLSISRYIEELDDF